MWRLKQRKRLDGGTEQERRGSGPAGRGCQRGDGQAVVLYACCKLHLDNYGCSHVAQAGHSVYVLRARKNESSVARDDKEDETHIYIIRCGLLNN
jgi:hypothetical protein